MTDCEKGFLQRDRQTREAWLQTFSQFALDLNDDVQRSTLGKSGREAIAIAARLSTPIPEQALPGGPERLVEILGEAADAAYITVSPGYLGYVPGGALYGAALADLISNCMNRFTGLAVESPALCRLEADVLDWLLAEFGLGDFDSARGVLTSGGSIANFCAIVAARHEHCGDDGDLTKATAYVSSQTHHSVAKALHLAGIPVRNVRAVAVDSRFRMDPTALKDLLSADVAEGLQPFLVVSTAGTTNTGAVDPLGAIADICTASRVWHHVDAAYGGGFVLCAKGKELLTDIERADSITIDPHKSLFLPMGTGCLLVRDGDKLRNAHEMDAAYLAVGDEGEPPSPAHYGPELTRPYRGLRLWLSLMLYGAEAFRNTLTEKLDLAVHFHQQLLRLHDELDLPIEVIEAPQLSTVTFRLERQAAESLAAWNDRNIDFVNRINASGRVFLSKTALPVADGAAQTLRVCVLNYRTRKADIDACLEVVEAAARETVARETAA
jgi:aromatic-L-amino-acid decarboxylase